MADGGRPGRLAKDGDLVGVSAKLVDVRLDPPERLHHVKHAHVAGGLVRVQAGEAEGAQAVVDGHHHHIGHFAQAGLINSHKLFVQEMGSNKVPQSPKINYFCL